MKEYNAFESPKIEKTIEVDVPLRTAYNQWTQFEEFPRFMEGVREVRQLDNKRLYWRAEIAGTEKAWTAEISEQRPDESIAWHSTSGLRNAGRVSFEPVGANTTLVRLIMDYEPQGVIENAADWVGVVSRRIEGDLERFKEFIEARGEATGAWRGTIHGTREV